MREIKFRKWDEENKEMIDGDCLAFEEYAPLSELLTQDGIMQYTGLTDKNGKEIYEGDILELKALETGFTALNWAAVVEFGNPNGEYNWGWQLKPIKGVGINPDILLWVETEMPNVSCNVIGNIYQNPELKGGE